MLASVLIKFHRNINHTNHLYELTLHILFQKSYSKHLIKKLRNDKEYYTFNELIFFLTGFPFDDVIRAHCQINDKHYVEYRCHEDEIEE